MKKRIISFVLVIVMSLGILPTFAFAATSGDFEYTVFSDCAYITGYNGDKADVVVPSTIGEYPVIAIGYAAFGDCYFIESITLPEGLLMIGSAAFENCISLKIINIPSTVMAITSDMFSFCKSLTEINVHPDNTLLKAEGNVLYSYEKDEIYICSEAVSGEFTVPDGVVEISTAAFRGCNRLESVVLPEGLETIQSEAFKDCTALKSITLPDSVVDIRDNAFYNTAYYNDPTNWEGSILYIDNHLIQAKNTVSSCYVKRGTKSIAGYAFYGCSSLISVVIADTVQVIGFSAFADCTGLTDVTLSSQLVAISDYAFLGCERLESIEIPESVLGLGNSVFEDCTRLETIIIPDDLVVIGTDVFANTGFYNNPKNWENGVLYLGNRLVKAKQNIKTCSVKDGTKVVLPYAFEDCSLLTEIEFPEGMVAIGQFAFANCVKLKKVTLPASIQAIGYEAFLYAPIEKVIYKGTHEQLLNIVLFLVFNDELLETVWEPGEDNSFVHVYDDDCDKECLCGYVREITHSFGDYVYNNDATYFSDGTKTRTCSVCSHSETVTAEGTKLKNKHGWVYENGWFYYDKNIKLTNCWKKDSIGWCYLGADGKMATNKWIKDSVGWCYVGSDGYCVTNEWVADSCGWCYLDKDGRMVTNKWVMDSVGWCYVGSDGYCITNSWQKDSVGWCYLDKDGRMVVNGWVRDSYGLCWLDESGYWDGVYH